MLASATCASPPGDRVIRRSRLVAFSKTALLHTVAPTRTVLISSGLYGLRPSQLPTHLLPALGPDNQLQYEDSYLYPYLDRSSGS
ncbi:hypothetical protein V8C34DRAFT_291900 [Trichoderma compactum]